MHIQREHLPGVGIDREDGTGRVFVVRTTRHRQRNRRDKWGQLVVVQAYDFGDRGRGTTRKSAREFDTSAIVNDRSYTSDHGTLTDQRGVEFECLTAFIGKVLFELDVHTHKNCAVSIECRQISGIVVHPCQAIPDLEGLVFKDVGFANDGAVAAFVLELQGDRLA